MTFFFFFFFGFFLASYRLFLRDFILCWTFLYIPGATVVSILNSQPL